MPITINGTTGISGVDGSSATPALQGTDTNTGISYGTDIVTINTGGTARVTTDASGNVGIGTSSPATALDVVSAANGIVQVRGGSATNQGSAFYVRNSANSSTLAAFGDRARIFGGTPDASVSLFTGSAAPLIFDVSGGEKARIDSSGNLLVGTTTVNGRISSVPKAGFNPSGTAGTWSSSAGMSSSGSFGGGFSWIDGAGGYCAWAENGGADFNIAGGLTGNNVANGVFLNGFSATSWSGRSDERLKQNLQPITDALNKTCSLRAVTGAYKNFPNEQQAFLLAQDVQKVLPEAVCVADKRSPEQYLGLAYTQVIPLLVAAIQELKAEIDLLKGN
jgi:hypothetical protein